MAALRKQVGGRALSYLSVQRGRPPASYGSGHSTTKRYADGNTFGPGGTVVAVFALAMLLRAAEPPPGATCLIALPVLPTRTGTFAILRATRDSASDGRYYPSIDSGVVRSPAYPSQRAYEVFGQLMRVVFAEGEGAGSLPRNRRVLVVWWGLGMSCQRAQPAGALYAARGELFLQLTLRDSVAWIGGTPTYDGSRSAVLYAPNGRAGLSRGDIFRPMSMREFVELYRVLPSPDLRARDPEAALQPLLAWAAAHRRRAAKSPAQLYVCAARSETEPRVVSGCANPPSAR